MEKFGAFLRLIRLPNLLIIAATQYLMRWCIMQPIVEKYGRRLGDDLHLQMSELDFFLLCLSTVMIAAAGYVINDYFDLKIDRINKPQKIVIDRYIKRRVAMGAHIVISVIAIAIGAYVAYKAGRIVLVSIHLFSAGSLWFYSTSFKNQFLTGNVVIALMAGLVPLVVGLYEVPLLNAAYPEHASHINEVGSIFNVIAYWILGYSGFAFLLTLIREITKDTIDIRGDKAYGCNTIPIVLGVKKTKIILVLLYVITFASLIYLQQQYLGDLISSIYVIGVLGGMAAYTTYVIIKARTKTQFARASLLNKLMSVAGILFAIIAGYTITNGPIIL